MDQDAVAEISSSLQVLKKRVLALGTSDEDRKKAITQDLILVKRQSRILHEEAAVSKENVHALSKAVDSAHLAIQSVHYEKKHLEKELEQCLATSVYDSIDFSQVKDVDMNSDQRALMDWKLQRVKEEVELRQAMAKDVEGLQSELSKVFNEVTALKDLLNGIPSKVDDLEKAMQALEKFVGVPSLSERRTRSEIVSKAPPPLFTLFRALEKAEEDARFSAWVHLKVKEEPLAIVLSVQDQTESIEFTYSPDWNIILVEPQVVQDLLVNLLDDGDTGETAPLLSTGPQKADPPTFKNTFKRPFKWAQVMAGIPLLLDSVSPAVLQLTPQELLQRILDKLKINILD